MAGLSAAAGFGTFTSEKDVTVSGDQASFSITVMNTGSQTLSVNFDDRGVDDATLRFEDNNDSIILPSSSVTKNPSQGGSWYYLGNGEYVETRKIKFTLFLQDSDYEEFTVDVRAQTVGSAEDEVNASQNIVQVRSYSYSVTSDGAGSNPQDDEQQSDPDVGFDFGGNDGGFSGLPGIGLGDGSSGNSGSDEGSDNDPDIEIGDGNDSGSEDETEEDQVTGGGQNSSSEDDGQGAAGEGSITGGFFQSQNINGVTVILLLGVMLSGVYLYRVM